MEESSNHRIKHKSTVLTLEVRVDYGHVKPRNISLRKKSTVLTVFQALDCSSYVSFHAINNHSISDEENIN